ncbi:MAG: phosphoribosylamine--glycine ligase [Planctomycetes bacterium]|nr:phosphoribosylamine--glycine ligase [Planctomycetota bacterium]
MRILVVGGGGREHVLADRLAASARVEEVLCAPGNAGTAAVAQNVHLAVDDHDALVQLARERRVDLTVVGPEAPLCAGLVDRFEAADLTILGPTAAAARIEGDKAYAKRLMHRCLVPTADGRIFDRFEAAKTYVATRDTPQVVKAAGLAAGKGVVVCDDPADAILALEEIMVDERFGAAGRTVLIEEKLKGPELSILALVDGHTIYVLESAQDYKRVGEGDTGPNTGGMGAISPAPTVPEEIFERIEREILVPIVDGLRSDGAPYRGVLYAGLMLTPAGPKVLEFNCRFGDPEAQAVLVRLQTDLADVLEATATGRLDQIQLHWDPRPAVCVVQACGGYPGQYQTGSTITGLDDAAALKDVAVFHAGTVTRGNVTVTAGGRVLGVTALGETVDQARARAYEGIDKISFAGAFCRRDIAAVHPPPAKRKGTQPGPVSRI